jgi:hypothetical protein
MKFLVKKNFVTQKPDLIFPYGGFPLGELRYFAA